MYKHINMIKKCNKECNNITFKYLLKIIEISSLAFPEREIIIEW